MCLKTVDKSSVNSPDEGSENPTKQPADKHRKIQPLKSLFTCIYNIDNYAILHFIVIIDIRSLICTSSLDFNNCINFLLVFRPVNWRVIGSFDKPVCKFAET